MIQYQEPLYRPPSEANSAIFQVAYGCPHNSCAFCGMYKRTKYIEKPLEETFREIDTMASNYPDTTRVFLADGDALHLSFATLKAITNRLVQVFPKLNRISAYANGSSLMSKSQNELNHLHQNKLHQIYLGLESGNNAILETMKKRETAERMIEGIRLAQIAGIRSSVMVLVGLGGNSKTLEHANDTIRVLNQMKPNFLSFLTVTPEPGTPLFRWVENGAFIPLNLKERLTEIHRIISGLELSRTVFRCNHVSNDIHLAGRFPKDKSKLLDEIDYYLTHLF